MNDWHLYADKDPLLICCVSCGSFDCELTSSWGDALDVQRGSFYCNECGKTWRA